MLNEKDIKPIPKYIIEKIRKLDEVKRNGNEYGTSYYSYLAKINKDIAHIVVACKIKNHQWLCKQVVVHTLHDEHCLVRDIEYTMFGYCVGWYNEFINSYNKQKYDGNWYRTDAKYFNMLCPIINKNYTLKFKQYKYSVADKYKYADLMKYLRIYEEYPQAEYLMKLDLAHFATNKAILKQIGKDKNFRKWIIKNKEILQNKYGQYPYMNSSSILSAYKKDLSIQQAQQQERKIKELLTDYSYRNSISKVIPKSEALTFIEYLEKQNTGLLPYVDYLRACETLGLDMNLPKNRYPKDFHKWHNIRIDQYNTHKALEDEKNRKELYNQFAQVAEKYLSLQRNLNEDYIMIIAKSPAELIKEGDDLSHCVGRMNYDQKFAKEESLIFFVRNKDNPQTPFVTVEYSLRNKKVLQCYGEHDHRPDDNVLNFVNKVWLPYANRKIKKVA